MQTGIPIVRHAGFSIHWLRGLLKIVKKRNRTEQNCDLGFFFISDAIDRKNE